jgi:hypothetical protein
LFQNPHGLEEISEADRSQLNALYSGKKYSSCIGQFAPGSTLSDQYFAYVDALQYIFIRNYKRSEIIKRISLTMFPSCMQMISFNKIQLDESASVRDSSKSSFLIAIGTTEGRVIVYRISQVSNQKLLQSKSGVSYGAITDLDISANGEYLIATNECGEIL